MYIPQWFKGLLIFIAVAAAFLGGMFWQGGLRPAPTVDPCARGAIPQSYALLNSLLREFDDALTLAINMPRELVVEQVETLQSIRRHAESMAVPGCVAEVKARMVDYMNQVVDLLVAFVGGVNPELVFQGLQSSDRLRDAMELEMAELTGATVTPYPTAFQFPIPVTGSGTGQVTATEPASQATPMAIVSNDQGANLRQEPNSESALIVPLPPETQVQVLGASSDRLWVYIQDETGRTGWLYLELLTLNIPVTELPTVE